MTHETAKLIGLEPVYSSAHELSEIVFWDTLEGQYYDASTDIYLLDYDPTSR